MDADRRLHLDVALEVEGEAIRGTVSDGVMAPREFSGWLELMSAFEIARSTRPGPGASMLTTAERRRTACAVAPSWS